MMDEQLYEEEEQLLVEAFALGESACKFRSDFLCGVSAGGKAMRKREKGEVA